MVVCVCTRWFHYVREQLFFKVVSVLLGSVASELQRSPEYEEASGWDWDVRSG